MVLTWRVGKPRPFWRGFLLTVLTAGVYAAYWTYRAPTEVHKQFELLQERRDDGVVWLVLAFLLPVLFVAYNVKFLGNVRYVRARLGLAPGTSAWTFTGLQLASAFLFLVVAGALLGVDADLLFAEDPADDEAAFEAFARAAFTAVAAGLAVAVPVLAYAYHRVQRDLNEVWRAFDARLDAITAPEEEAEPDHVPPT